MKYDIEITKEQLRSPSHDDDGHDIAAGMPDTSQQLVHSLILECSETGAIRKMAITRPMPLAEIFYTFKVAMQRRRENDRQLAATLCKGVCRIIY